MLPQVKLTPANRASVSVATTPNRAGEPRGFPTSAVIRCAIWVREPQLEGWRDARTSRFVSGAKTPMDYGFAVVAGEPEGSLTLDQVWTQLEQADRERRASRR